MKSVDRFLASTASRACGVASTEGLKMGVELELEGPGVGLQDEPTKGWRRTADGSLRGESIEFVLSTPMVHENCVKAVNHLFSKFEKNKVKFNDSIRTSTHVHLNFSDKPLRQAINFFCLFTMLEEILEFYSGEDRAGNLFCLSSRRTDEIAAILQQCIREGNLRSFAGDRYKYAACNLSTLFKFGSVEVRTMRGANSAEQVNKWLSILNDMYEYSINSIESPTDLVISLSHEGYDGFFRMVFKEENREELLQAAPEGFDFFRSLIEGARLVQPLAYEFEDAFRFRPTEEELVMPVGEGRLLRRAADGQPGGIRIERLSGDGWTAHATRRNVDASPVFWRHHERLSDADTIRWNEIEFCFEEDETGDDDWIPLEFIGDIERFRG